MYAAESAESVAASTGEELSTDYDIIKEEYSHKNAGSCIRIDASSDINGHSTEAMLSVYIIPAPDGCVIA